MQFEFVKVVTHPIAVVYPVIRDDMASLLPWLPGIDRVEVLERDAEVDGTHRVLNKWHGTADSAPPSLRKFVNKDMVTWLDHALWIDAKTRVEWRMETIKFKGLYECSGVNYWEDLGDGTTRMRITGDLLIYPDKIPGVPKFLAKKLAPKVEAFLTDAITPNMSAMPDAIQRYLDEKA
ncbi:MAG: hypothetical protein ACI9WU_003203 [Myxococcota bacterium]|jgi:hypothetical protein